MYNNIFVLQSKSPMKNTPILKKSPKKISPSLPAREVAPKPPVQLDHSVEDNVEISEPTNSKPGEKKEIVLHYFSGSLVIDSQTEDDHYDVIILIVIFLILILTKS